MVTAAGGLGLLVGGTGPRDTLHLVYGMVALGSLPIGNALSRGARPRRAALIALAARIVLVAVIVRLFQTG